MTVMAIGDPHIKSLDFNDQYLTCHGFEYFNNKTPIDNLDEGVYDGTLAAKTIVLISNEMFSLEGKLARWSPDSKGTYFTKVCSTSSNRQKHHEFMGKLLISAISYLHMKTCVVCPRGPRVIFHLKCCH